MAKEDDAFRTISEAAEVLGVPQHVLRFWELKFPQINPLKRGGGRRYYRPGEIALLGSIRDLLYADGYTIKGVQRLLREQGVRAVSGMAARLHSPGDHPRTVGDPDDLGVVTDEAAAIIPDATEGRPAGTVTLRFRLQLDELALELDECAAVLAAAALSAQEGRLAEAPYSVDAPRR